MGMGLRPRYRDFGEALKDRSFILMHVRCTGDSEKEMIQLYSPAEIGLFGVVLHCSRSFQRPSIDDLAVF